MENIDAGDNFELKATEGELSKKLKVMRGDAHAKQNDRSRKSPILEASGLCTTETEAVRDYNSRPPSKEFGKSKKPKLIRMANGRFSTTLDYNIYCLVER